MPKYVLKEGALIEPQKGVWKEWAIHVAETKWELFYPAKLSSRERERQWFRPRKGEESYTESGKVVQHPLPDFTYFFVVRTSF